MPHENIIAMRYARGIAEVAIAQDRMDEVRWDLDILVALVEERGDASTVPALLDFLASPTVADAEKCRTAGAVLEKGGVGKIVTDFLNVLIRRRRVRLVPHIYTAFAEAADALTGDRTAVVRTAMPLTEEQERRLAEALAAATGARVWLRQEVVPGLLAGAKVSIGDRSFDGTVRGKLDRLGRALAERAFAGAAADAADADGQEHIDS